MRVRREINVAYVIDASQLADASVDFSKCEYVAIGVAHETEGGAEPLRSRKIMGGRIGRAFGFGKQPQ
jgi:hypothetical protein